jgi:hypothetical protein
VEDYELPDGSPGSGVDRIEYRKNGSEEWIQYTDDIQLNSSGYHSLQFRSIDKAGNKKETTCSKSGWILNLQSARP